jgi:NADPH2:quinone reductase
MAVAMRIEEPGGIDRLERVELTLPPPRPGEIAIRHKAIGVNFIDIYHRTGLYALPVLPAVLGVEGAGTVAAIGAEVTALAVGDRVAYAGAPVGAYASERLMPAARAVALPASVPEEIAAAGLVKGITAYMLLTLVHPVRPGTSVLVHSAAGGVGNLLARWAKRLGARVIGTVSSDAKAKVAREAGADHVIVGRDADFASEVGALTGGRGVDVAYDGIGGTVLAKTFACVRPFGTVASIGQAAGPIPPIHVEELGPRRAVTLARPSVMAYMSDAGAYRHAAAEVLTLLAAGVAPVIGAAYPLTEAAQAHADLEAGRTTGSVILIP